MWFLLGMKFLAGIAVVFGKHIVNLAFDMYEYFEGKNINQKNKKEGA